MDAAFPRAMLALALSAGLGACLPAGARLVADRPAGKAGDTWREGWGGFRPSESVLLGSWLAA